MQTARHSQSNKTDISSIPGLGENKERRNSFASLTSSVKCSKNLPQQFITATFCFVQLLAGVLVVTKIRKRSRINV
jgi:hypothetical protein